MEIEHIRYVTNEVYLKAKKHLSEFNNNELNNIENILGISILKRIVGNLNSTRFLLSEVSDNPNIEPAIGLILRNNLSLCRIVFIHNELKNSNQDLKKFYRAIFGENIQRTIKYIKKNTTQEELLPYLKSIKNSFSFILNETGLDIENIENEIIEPKFNLSKNFNSLKNLFIAFSKYEHFGLNTLILQDNNDLEDKLERIEIAVHYSLQGILICLLMLNITDNELMQMNKELAQKTNI